MNNINLLNNKLSIEKMIQLNYLIHNKNSRVNYHMNHIKLSARYASKLCDMTNNKRLKRKMQFIMITHDLLKDKCFDDKVNEIKINNYIIPTNLNWYVRTNLDVLIPYKLDDLFNTSIGLHPLAVGIFMIKTFHINDESILYPLMFHSCPIISIYKTLSNDIKFMVDITMLSDKLSSSTICKNNNKPIPYDLHKITFGENDNELNLSLALYITRLITQKKSNEKYSIEATKHYLDRLKRINPLIPNKIK